MPLFGESLVLHGFRQPLVAFAPAVTIISFPLDVSVQGVADSISAITARLIASGRLRQTATTRANSGSSKVHAGVHADVLARSMSFGCWDFGDGVVR